VLDTVCDELNMAPSEANRFNSRGNMSAIFSCHILFYEIGTALKACKTIAKIIVKTRLVIACALEVAKVNINTVNLPH
jgi:hypothetical protein